MKHWDWEVEVDFKSKRLRCTATLHVNTLTEGVANVVSSQLHDTHDMDIRHSFCSLWRQILDCTGLEVSEVVSAESGQTLQFEVKTLEGALTPCLSIALPSSCAKKCV